MSTPRSQKLAALLAVAWVIAQPTVRSPLLAGFWSLGRGEDGLAHSLAFEADAGHIDLVVSHAHEDDCVRSRRPLGSEATARPDLACCRASDHVVHLAADPAARETGQAQPTALQRAPLVVSSYAEALAPLARPAPLLGVTELLRTVVLRS